jgi:hypothetical protein
MIKLLLGFLLPLLESIAAADHTQDRPALRRTGKTGLLYQGDGL